MTPLSYLQFFIFGDSVLSLRHSHQRLPKELLLRFPRPRQFDGWIQIPVWNLDVHIPAIQVDECASLA